MSLNQLLEIAIFVAAFALLVFFALDLSIWPMFGVVVLLALSHALIVCPDEEKEHNHDQP